MSKRQINDENNDYNLQRSICTFGVASVLVFNAASASALPPDISMVNEANTIYTSSIQLSQTIKTMDFSLPSSYDSISDVSKPASDALVQEENIVTGSKKKVQSSSASTKPSSAMTPEEKATLAAEKEAIAAERAAEKADLDAEKLESKRIAREAKEKAKAEKEVKAKEESMKGVEFVDIGLPSYEIQQKKSAL
jgi:hypothetical protein